LVPCHQQASWMARMQGDSRACRARVAAAVLQLSRARLTNNVSVSMVSYSSCSDVTSSFGIPKERWPLATKSVPLLCYLPCLGQYGERRQKSCVCIKICIVTYAVGIVAPACRISDIEPTISSQPPVAPCSYRGLQRAL